MVRNLKFTSRLILAILSGLTVSICAKDSNVRPEPMVELPVVQDNIKLLMIPPVGSPVIENRNYKFTIDFVFNSCPQEYWIHYNRTSGRLIIEFFGITIDAPAITIKGTSIVKDLLINNDKSILSLNDKCSQVSVALEQGWHYDSWVISGKTLRLQLWMPLNPSKRLLSRQMPKALPFILTVIGVAGATMAIIIAATNHTAAVEE